jgi:hypothetical protein
MNTQNAKKGKKLKNQKLEEVIRVSLKNLKS